MIKLIRSCFSLLILIICAFSVKAQTANVRGLLTDEFNNPMSNTKVVLAGTKFTTVTSSNGAFSFKNVPFGDYQLEVKENDYAPLIQAINVSQKMLDIGKISLIAEVKGKTSDDQIPTLTLDEDDLKESGSQTVSSALGASRDVFASAATYTFSTARYRIRGYDDENFVTLMNGVPMTDLSSGRTMFSSWGGLNDVMRSKESVYGLSPANYAFGGVGGAFSIDSRASKQRRQLQVSYANSNRAYENRFMVTYGSGILPGGWSFSTSLSRRWANEGYVPGSYYDGWAYFAAVEKSFGKHSLSLTHFGSHTMNTRTSPATIEAFELAGTHYYNPNWGYQEGKKRSANNNNINVPVTILSHEWTINNRSSLETSFSYQAGKEKRSGLNWFNAHNPKADYYRLYPHFLAYLITDLTQAQQQPITEELRNLIINNRDLIQINWADIYEGNRSQIDTFKNTVGYRSNIILEDRVEANHYYTASTIYNNVWNDRWTFSGGAIFQRQETEYFKQVNDLLGGDFFTNLDQYAEQDPNFDVDAQQNDLNNPDRVLKVGDKFGYDYTLDTRNTQLWAQQQFKADHLDFYLSGQVSHTDFVRTGHYRSGVFSENSFGESQKYNFDNYFLKTGLTYKMNGRNYIYGNMGYGSRAPHFDQVFISANNRNQVQDDIKDVVIISAEVGYIYTSPRFKAKGVLYNTDFANGAKILRYYNDDLATFVNFALRGIDERHQGAEISAEAGLGKGFSVTGVASIGNNYYTSRMLSSTYYENKNQLGDQNQLIYSKNYKLGGTQSAYTIGSIYRSKKFWMAGINVNYFDNIWVDFSPIRRTLKAVDGKDANSQEWRDILDQEELNGQLTIDVFANKSWKLNNKYTGLKNNTFLVVNVGINNLLDNKDFRTSGGENLRLDQSAGNDIKKFQPRYFYSFGLNYFVSVTLRMN